MIFAFVVSCVLVALTIGIHYEVLQALWFSLPRITIPSRLRMLVVIIVAFLAHAAEITLYAGAFYFLRDKFQIGSFSGAFTDRFSSFLYFSAESYSSLGMGDIFPIGPLRMVTGIESLNGLILIAWTASFTYMAMEKYWRLGQK
jgi:hypothetical protein